jgi:hypothetical protein
MTAPTAPNPRRRTALLAAFTLILTAGALAPKAGAQKSESTTTPYAEFQNSTLTGTTNTINVGNVPLVSSTGAITYDNVTITFKVSSTGVLSVSSTKVVAAPATQTDGFMAGTYVSPGNGETIVVTGPGVNPDGSTAWSFATTSGGCENQYTGNWYVGAIANSPYYIRVTDAKAPLTTYSYGEGGSNCNATDWQADSLLGLYQSGNSIVISSFSTNGDASGSDQNEPVGTITYTLQQ